MGRKKKGEIRRTEQVLVKLDPVELEGVDALAMVGESRADVFRRLLRLELERTRPDFTAEHATAPMSRKDFEDVERARQREAEFGRRVEAEEITAEMRPPVLEDLERDRVRKRELQDVPDTDIEG